MNAHRLELALPLLMLLTLAVATSHGAVPAMASDNSPHASASGSGHFRYLGDLRTFTFTARTHADGTVRGQAQLNSRGFPARIHVALDCLVIVGATAYMSGVVTASDNPQFPVGSGAAFGVTDNGDAGGGVADQMTAWLVPWGDRCSGFGTQSTIAGEIGFYAVERGNVQVR